MLHGSSVAIVCAKAGLDEPRKRHPMEDAQNTDELTDTVIPNLERRPRIGPPFLDRPASSLEAERRIETLRAKLGASNGGGSALRFESPSRASPRAADAQLHTLAAHPLT